MKTHNPFPVELHLGIDDGLTPHTLCEYAFMRTTLDIPDEVFKKAKLQAVHEGIPLKDVITRALQREFAPTSGDAAVRKARARRLFAALDKARNTQPVGRLNRQEIYDRPVLRGH